MRMGFLVLLIALAAIMVRPTAPSAAEAPTYAQVKQWISQYKRGHPGRGGKDWDIHTKTAKQLASEPDTRRLCELCGPDRRPVIPELAWEYGGSDHAWESPEKAALVYCVYTPVARASPNWQFDEAKQRVTALVYILFPEQDPCAGKSAEQHAALCIGGHGNLEILGDTASMSREPGFSRSLDEASTELRLRLPGGKTARLALID